VTWRGGPPLLSRRDFLIRSGVAGAAGLGLPAFLASCADIDGGSPTDQHAQFDNWPEYIDGETVSAFQTDTGFTMNYFETFNDNNEYFARVVPALSRGKRIEADILAPTSWMAGRFISLGWAQPLPVDLIPNGAAYLRDDLRNPTWDPTGEYSLPWQTGITGIAYNVSATERELGSVTDLFDPEFNGRIGMLSEMRDTVGLILLGLGIDPSTATTYEDVAPAFDQLEQAKNDGQIRQFTGNDYIDDLAVGNFAACVGWSGDVVQLSKDNPDVRFIIPEEGGMSWADTMIWVTGSNRRDAVAAWMDYVFDPEHAARLTAEVQFVPPVAGVADVLLASGDEELAALAEDPLLFPDAETTQRLRAFANLPPEDEALCNERFADITGA
jgi:spermidine/putrescine transport system substrate-binding protein